MSKQGVICFAAAKLWSEQWETLQSAINKRHISSLSIWQKEPRRLWSPLLSLNLTQSPLISRSNSAFNVVSLVPAQQSRHCTSSENGIICISWSVWASITPKSQQKRRAGRKKKITPEVMRCRGTQTRWIFSIFTFSSAKETSGTSCTLQWRRAG